MIAIDAGAARVWAGAADAAHLAGANRSGSHDLVNVFVQLPGFDPERLYLCHGCESWLPASCFHAQRDRRRPRAYCKTCRRDRRAHTGGN